MPRFTPVYGDADRMFRNIHDFLVRLGADPGAAPASGPVTIVAAAGNSGAGSLEALDDVDVTAPASGEALVYNGASWGNSVVSLLGDVTGAITATVVAKINGKTAPTPASTDDGMELAYDHAGSQYVLRRHKEKTLGKTATYTATLNDTVLLCNATTGALTINLPAAASALDHVLTVKKIDASVNAVTLDGNGAETIDGAATQVIGTQWSFLRIVSNGTAWFVIGS